MEMNIDIKKLKDEESALIKTANKEILRKGKEEDQFCYFRMVSDGETSSYAFTGSEIDILTGISEMIKVVSKEYGMTEKEALKLLMLVYESSEKQTPKNMMA